MKAKSQEKTGSPKKTDATTTENKQASTNKPIQEVHIQEAIKILLKELEKWKFDDQTKETIKTIQEFHDNFRITAKRLSAKQLAAKKEESSSEEEEESSEEENSRDKKVSKVDEVDEVTTK